MPDGAAFFRGSSGTRQGKACEDDRERGACWCGAWNDVVWDSAFQLLVNGPRHTTAKNRKRQCNGLLLFEPVLLQARQRGQAGIGTELLAAAFLVVQIRSTMRAKAAAVAAADHLHGNGQVHLLGQHV